MTSHWPACLRTDSSSLRRAGSGRWITHLHSFERLDDRFGDDEAGVLLIGGRDHMPRRLLYARRAETGFVGHHVVVPVCSLSQSPMLRRQVGPGTIRNFPSSLSRHWKLVGLPMSETAPKQQGDLRIPICVLKIRCAATGPVRAAIGNDTPWCNGNTAPFGGVIHGSNPCGVVNPARAR